MSVVGTVVSARTASRRLPGKALLDLQGIPIVQFLLERIRGTRLGGPVVFATTQRLDDDVLAAHVESLGIPVFRGADDDVAGRHVAAARAFGIDWIVRVTGDCPFVDAGSLDHCLAQWDATGGDELVSTKGVFPVGIDYELFPTALLEREWPKMSADEKEHLTLRFYRADLGFAVRRFSAPTSWPRVERSYLVDTPADYERAVARAARFVDRRFSVQALLELPEESAPCVA
jgi:spore coat polysaccharide biosynthesis protein SpsF (cytidylyltransferase family)